MTEVPEPPKSARILFGSRLELAERYVRLLAGPGVERGLLGPREADRLWDRHLLNCVVLAELVPAGSAVVDIGSGAGLPGLVLAIAREDLRITLLEPLERRTRFLDECVTELRLTNVTVRRARAEDVADGFAADVVTARAVAPLDRLIGWALPLLKPGGELLALKGSKAGEELAAAESVLRRFGVLTAEVVGVGHDSVDPPATVVRVVTARSVEGPAGGNGRTGRRRGVDGRKRRRPSS